MAKLGELVDGRSSHTLVERCGPKQLQSLALVAKHNPDIAREVIERILASSVNEEVRAAE